jgi:rare lipoprotein A
MSGGLPESFSLGLIQRMRISLAPPGTLSASAFAAFVAILPLMILQVGCASLDRRGSAVSLYDSKPISIEIGKASYYGGRWIGRLTANGEHYRASDCTAAHKKLPFNSIVRVTNLKNGKSVIVRINNRGPYAKGRILDLSVVAARKIDMIGDGVIKVKAEVLKPIEVISKPNRQLTEVR